MVGGGSAPLILGKLSGTGPAPLVLLVSAISAGASMLILESMKADFARLLDILITGVLMSLLTMPLSGLTYHSLRDERS